MARSTSMKVRSPIGRDPVYTMILLFLSNACASSKITPTNCHPGAERSATNVTFVNGRQIPHDNADSFVTANPSPAGGSRLQKVRSHYLNVEAGHALTKFIGILID